MLNTAWPFWPTAAPAPIHTPIHPYTNMPARDELASRSFIIRTSSSRWWAPAAAASQQRKQQKQRSQPEQHARISITHPTST